MAQLPYDNEFKEYFETNIKPNIMRVELDRKAYIAVLVVILFFVINYLGLPALMFVFMTIITIILGILGSTQDFLDFSIGLVEILASFVAMYFVPVGILHYVRSSFSKGYRSNFKNIVIPAILNFVSPDFSYDLNGKMEKEDIRKSDLVDKNTISYKGEDLIRGAIIDKQNQEVKTNICFSEVRINTFRGLFIKIDFNKDFEYETLVLHKGKILIRDGYEKVMLEDNNFNDQFTVYSSNQIEARYILTPSLIGHIYDFKVMSGKEIDMSFIDGYLYIMIPYSKNLFEPKLFKTVYDIQGMNEYYSFIKFILSIVEELNLNLRIWTKQ